jgi:hypothetical protein
MTYRISNRACGRISGIALIGLAFLLAGDMKALAQQNIYTWTGGGGNNDWSNASNWSGGVPASGASARSSLEPTQPLPPGLPDDLLRRELLSSWHLLPSLGLRHQRL